MSTVDTWETVAAVAMHCGRKRTVRGATYAIGAYRVARNLNRLSRYARKLHRLYEDMCNGTIRGTEAILNYSAAERYATRWEKACETIGREIGIVVTTQRDPRGASVKMWADKENGRMLGCF